MTKLFLILLPCLIAAAAAAELPVKEVILFKHGVGFFSRSGEVKAGETVRLDFKASDMNDVLKSLTVTEKGGGRVTGLRYDASEPLGQKLAEFPFKIGDAFALSAVLDQMKGARVEIKYGSDTIAGQIVSGREASGISADKPTREQLILLLDSGEMRLFDLSASPGIRFLDPLVQRQFGEYLRAISQSRSKEKRSLYIDSTAGAAARSITANYMTPSAVWKSSYRLIFDQNEPTLEGWAIVDNTTDEDWNGVQLAVVSGRPVSFISRLYEPRYRQRQVAELAEERTAGPVVYESAMQMATAAPPPPVFKAMAPGAAGYARGRVMSEALGEVSAVQVADSTVAVNTQGRELGDLFEYRFSTPVTVKKSESAMLPFLRQKLNSRKILIYQESQGANPMNAAEISNSTGKALDGGPITVYDGGVYAGEALMETLKASDKRLISYAVDLGTRISTAIDSSRSNVRQVSAKRGVVTTRYALQETKTYTIRNVDAKAKTLILEHPLRGGYRLTSAAKPTETTTNSYRFEIKLAASATEKFAVQEENLYSETTLVSSLSPDAIVSFLGGRAVSDGGRRQLEQIAERKRQSAEADTQARNLEAEMNELIRDQDRLRQNIGSLLNVTGQNEQVQVYSRQLATQETQIASMRDQIREQRRKKLAVDKEILAMLEKLDF